MLPMAGTLFIVATPIGNLEDMTFRAVRVLKEVDLIAAEDTRHTKNLLNHYGINTPLTSYHEHNERNKAHQLVARLLRGESIAVVSDAGTPAISDPGFRVVVEAVEAGVRIVPVPGASALSTVLSASGLPTDRFVFEGFLPAKKRERRALLQTLRSEPRTCVFYEAPHRLSEALADIHEILGDREIVLAREVSKVHEEFLRGRLSEIIRGIANREIRGELTLVLGGSEEKSSVSEDLLKKEIRSLKAEGVRVKDIAEILGEKYSYSKKDIYRLAFLVDENVNP